MAHKKAGGSTAWGRDSHGQRLGVKLYEGQIANPGSIIIRQRGTKYRLGENVKIGCDDTIYSAIQGIVHFSHKMIKKFDGSLKKRTVVNVVSQQTK